MATAYEAPEYGNTVVESEVGVTGLLMRPYSGVIGAKLTVISDTMLLGKLPSLCWIVDGWFADELVDTNATATSQLKVDVTDGTLTYNLMAARLTANSGAQTHTRFTELTNALGTQLVDTNANSWDVKVTATAGAATAGTVGLIRCYIQYICTDSYRI